MKFLCIECDQQMDFDERKVPGDGTFAASFRCPGCGRRIAMLANPMETQLVNAMGVEIGGSVLTGDPFRHVEQHLALDEEAPTLKARPAWTAESEARLARVPSFVRGMVKRIYVDWAMQHGVAEITPAVMDRARVDLGLEGM